jgi:hypothetical protein
MDNSGFSDSKTLTRWAMIDSALDDRDWCSKMATALPLSVYSVERALKLLGGDREKALAVCWECARLQLSPSYVIETLSAPLPKSGSGGIS